MGRRRSKVQNTERRVNEMYKQKRKRKLFGRSHDLSCPKCYDAKLTPLRGKHCINFRCGNCGLKVTMPRHPVLQVCDMYSMLCDYVQTGKEPLFHYKRMNRKIYEHILKYTTLGTIIVEEVIS